MDCPTCQQVYVLCTESLSRLSDDTWRGNAWVPGPLYRSFRDVRANKVTLWREMVDLFAAKHGDAWDAKMRSLPSKKARHKALWEMKLYVGNLETSYRHGGDHNCVLQDVYTFSSIPAMLAFIDVVDEDLNALFVVERDMGPLEDSLRAKLVAARRR